MVSEIVTADDNGNVFVTVGETTWTFDVDEPVTLEDVAAMMVAKEWFDNHKKEG